MLSSKLHLSLFFNVHGSVHRNNILIYIQQDAKLHSLFYLETALHVLGGTITHHQESKNCIYSIWYLSHRYCYLPLSWKSWNWFECLVQTVLKSGSLKLLELSGSVQACNGIALHFLLSILSVCLHSCFSNPT
jgi:hypothetical protein